MSLPRPRPRLWVTALCSRLKWEEEQPPWFKEEVKPRIPPEFLKGLEKSAAPETVLSPETKFRKALGDALPWSLDAPAFATWLEENWVQREEDGTQADARLLQRQKRRQFVQETLSDTDGFELLMACTTTISVVPFVRISQTKAGEKILDGTKTAAEQLTAFLHRSAGLAYHYQLACACSETFPSPLLEYSYVQLVEESRDALGAIIKHNANGELHVIKLISKSRFK